MKSDSSIYSLDTTPSTTTPKIVAVIVIAIGCILGMLNTIGRQLYVYFTIKWYVTSVAKLCVPVVGLSITFPLA